MPDLYSDLRTIPSSFIVVFQLRTVMFLYDGRWTSLFSLLCAALLMSLRK